MAKLPEELQSPSAQQWVFIKEFVKDLDGPRAAKLAGYKSHDGRFTQTARRILASPVVQKYIQIELKNIGHNPQVTVPRVLQELMRIAFFDPAKLFDSEGRALAINDVDEDTRRCIGGIEITYDAEKETTVKRYKIIDKHKALENLGRHLAMFTDKLNVTIPEALEKMTDDQLTNTIHQLASAAGINLSVGTGEKTKH